MPEIAPSKVHSEPERPDWRHEVSAVWGQMPHRWVVIALIGAWFALFHWLGNSTLGYSNTPSLFRWWLWVYLRPGQHEDGTYDFGRVFSSDEAYGWFIPAIVIALIWCRREEWVSLPKDVSWLALVLFVLAALLHVLGYLVQQTRFSIVGFALGLYALTGLFWGRGWLRATFFPFALLVFCVPLGNAAEFITFPLRMMATKITAVVCDMALGIHVRQIGTQLIDPGGSYQYEVAAACSGIRSLTAILAFGMIYAYLNLQSFPRRLAIVAASLPLALAGNVFRLTLIILSAEAFGQRAGNYVHESSWMSLAPYIPAMGGVLLLGWWLREDRKKRGAAAAAVMGPVRTDP